jgi:DNA-binding NarL/FixJ family response regulator
MSVKVIIADDHDVVRAGIRAVIERKGKDIEIVGEASNGKEVLNMAKKNSVEVYVLDIAMPILNGIETTERLIKLNSKNKVIIFSLHDDRHLVEKALKCGAKGYILKENATEEVIRAISEVYNGNFFLSPKISKYIVHGFMGGGGRRNYMQKENIVNLTRREREILQLIAEGFNNNEIAKHLILSLYTVRAHRNNIMKKLDIHRQADLIRYALKEGISNLDIFH